MTMELEDIARLALHGANQYAVLGTDGKIKAKGVTFIRDFAPCSSPSEFQAPNVLIIGQAITDALLRDVPPENTIYTCKDLRRFCRVIKRTKKVVGRTIGGPDGPQEPLGKVTRYYHARGSGLRITDTLESGKKRAGATRDKVRLANDIGDEFPADIDRQSYVEAAREVVQGIRSYRHLDPRHVPDIPVAQQALEAGLSPVPKRLVGQDSELRAKGVRKGTRPSRPTLLHDWYRIETAGTNTGPEVGILVADIDDPAKWSKAVARRKINDPWGSLGDCLVSSHGSATAESVRSCAEHVRQLGGASPLHNLMEVKC
jgi:hypothetical protein